MAKFRKKPVEIEAITFQEFVEYGKKNTTNIVNGMPWSFDYNGYPVTHENDECYLIPTLEGSMKFTPQDMLITGVNGEIYPCKLPIFAKTYERVLGHPEPLRCGGLNKFIIINRDDLAIYIPEFGRVWFDNLLKSITGAICIGRNADGKKIGNEYLVINTDEPYAGEIIEIMKRNGHWG